MINYCIKHCFSIENSLHHILAQNLKRRGLLPLKKFQEEAFLTIQRGQNIFVNSCTGSGKTLAYLVPVINALYRQQDSKRDEWQKGALILTLNKQLVGQIYSEAKQLDRDSRLGIYRTGSFQQTKDILGSDAYYQDVQQGFVNTILWNKIDLLISTPQTLANYINIYKQQKSKQIYPQFFVVDEADLLLELDKNVSRNTDILLKHIRDNSPKNSNIKYLLTASSFPKKYKGHESMERLKENFKTLNCIEGIDKHKLPQNLDLYYIEMKQKQEDRVLAEKQYFLKRVLSDRKKERIIIFCKQKSTISLLSDLIKSQLNIEPAILYADLKTEERAAAIASFSSGQTQLLICSELGSRGLDFALPVDSIIEFDMAENIVHFINRAGRTARNGLKGQVITFVEPKNKQFFEHLKTLKAEGEEFDQLFSRKRSYSKLYRTDVEQVL